MTTNNKPLFMKTSDLIESLKDNNINDMAFIYVYFFREKAYIYDSISMFDGKETKTCAICPIRIIIQYDKGHKPLFIDFTNKFKELFKDTIRFTFKITPSRTLRDAHRVNMYVINPNAKTFTTKSGTMVSYYPTSVKVNLKQVKLLDSLLKEFDSSPNAKYEKDKNNEDDDEIYDDCILSLIH